MIRPEIVASEWNIRLIFGPMMVRWPGTVKPGTVINDIFSHEDWMPTLLAAVGEPNIKEKLLKRHSAGGKNFKAHLDGYNQTDLLSRKGPGKRNEIIYLSYINSSNVSIRKK